MDIKYRLQVAVQHVIHFGAAQRDPKLVPRPAAFYKCSFITKLWYNDPQKYKAQLQDIMAGKSTAAPAVETEEAKTARAELRRGDTGVGDWHVNLRRIMNSGGI